MLSRSLDGAPGAWVLTPLVTGDGTAVVVNRGWIQASGPPVLPPGAEAPAGEVVVRGLRVGSERRGRFGPVDQPGVRLDTLARADIGRLEQQVDEDLHPLYLQWQQQVPPAVGPPFPLPYPELDEGPHLGYAGQWFLFTAVALVGYPLLVRRSARQRRLGRSERDPVLAAPPGPPGPPGRSDPGGIGARADGAGARR